MDIMLADSFFYYLVLVGFAAGLMDAAVGGGGLLQIPGLFNLLPNSTPVASVMGVNKFASCCGTVTATGQYLRRIPVPWKMLLPAAVLAFAASYLGANAVAYFPVQYMKPAMLNSQLATLEPLADTESGMEVLNQGEPRDVIVTVTQALRDRFPSLGE
mgnify:CR=1 FL=1